MAGTTNWGETEKVYSFMKSYMLKYMLMYISAVHTISYFPVCNVHYPWKRKLILTIVNPLTYLIPLILGFIANKFLDQKFFGFSLTSADQDWLLHFTKQVICIWKLLGNDKCIWLSGDICVKFSQ